MIRAIQLHPTTPALYILSSSLSSDGNGTGAYESPDKARTLLQRGLRMNRDSEELWVEYIKFEMGFVETLRRRWEVLGIVPGNSKDAESENQGMEQVLRGAIVKAVIEEASKALGAKVTFYRGLLELVEQYPFEEEVRREVREVAYTQLREQCWRKAEGRWMYVQRDLPGVDADEWDMDVLRERHEEMLDGLDEEGEKERYRRLYEGWLSGIVANVGVEELKTYLEMSYKRRGG